MNSKSHLAFLCLNFNISLTHLKLIVFAIEEQDLFFHKKQTKRSPQALNSHSSEL